MSCASCLLLSRCQPTRGTHWTDVRIACGLGVGPRWNAVSQAMATRQEPSVSLAASAWAEGELAVAQAVSAAVAGIGDGAARLVLIFPDAELEPEAVLGQATSAAPG